MTGSGFFVPEPDQVNPAWFHEWGNGIGSSALADELFGNMRLRKRTYEQFIKTVQMEVDTPFSAVELACLNAYASDKKKLARICGLVVYGKILRENIAKPEFERVVKQLPLDEMKIAVKLRDLHFEDLSYSVDMARLSELVERTGTSCVALWRHGLHPQMKLRIDLLEEPGHQGEFENAIVNPEQATAIVAAVSNTIWAGKPVLTA